MRTLANVHPFEPRSKRKLGKQFVPGLVASAAVRGSGVVVSITARTHHEESMLGASDSRLTFIRGTHVALPAVLFIGLRSPTNAPCAAGCGRADRTHQHRKACKSLCCHTHLTHDTKTKEAAGVSGQKATVTADRSLALSSHAGMYPSQQFVQGPLRVH